MAKWFVHSLFCSKMSKTGATTTESLGIQILKYKVLKNEFSDDCYVMCLLSSLDQRQLLRKRKMILIYSIYICKKWNSLWLCVCSMSFILINKSHFLHNLCFECIIVGKIHFKLFQFRSFSESNCLYIHILPNVNPNVLRIRSETFTKQKVWWFPLK